MRSTARLLKRGLIDIYWAFRGPRIRVPDIPNKPQSFLFVCKGNICRSPFAEHLALKLQDDRRFAGLLFGSAGLHVPKPISPPQNAIQAAKRYGVHLENHRSQSISLELVKSYDMIIAMEAWQYADLRSSFVDHRDKLFLLPLLDYSVAKGYAAFNIQDPYGCAPSAFEACFERISKCIDGFLTIIMR